MESPDDVTVSYSDGESETPADYPRTTDKIEKAIAVTRTALEEYRNPAVMWTGGKDSTLALYFVAEVADEFGHSMPPAIFIDHYQHFDSVHEFVDRWSEAWDVDVVTARNEDIRQLVDEPGSHIDVDELSEDNRREVRDKLEYTDETFPFLLDTYVGNHLLKTVPLNDAIRSEAIDGVISGVRWDEQEARAEETFFSPRHDTEKYPPHDRIHPILQFEERDVWEVTWNEMVPDTVSAVPDDGLIPSDVDDLPAGVTFEDLPVSRKYYEGFRSLGSEVSTERTTREPAWIQDLDGTEERAGRAQDKEDLMARLRDLGYM